MIKLFKKLLKDPFFLGSYVMIFGSNFVNGLNYVNTLVLGRLLGPSNYGELISLISLIGLIGILPSSLLLVIVKYVSSTKDEGEILEFIKLLFKKVIPFVILIFLMLILASPIISSFLKLNNNFFIILVAAVFITSLPTLLYKSVLQGLLKFNSLVIINIAETSTKLALGTALVFLGYSVGGALVALIISSLTSWGISFYFTNKHFSKVKKTHANINYNWMLKYCLPIFIQSAATTSIFSTDLILVKHFFSPYDAGIYAALSTLGKIIFFSTGPIGAVMFPMISKKQSVGEKYKSILVYSLLLTLAISFLISFIYYLFPDFCIRLLYGNSYIGYSNLLVLFGLFTTIFTVCQIFINYYLSLNRSLVVILPLVAAILQFIGIWFYHSDIKMVIEISIIVSIFLLISMLPFSLLKRTKIL